MEIQQHDGVVVDVAGLGRASASFSERERCSRGRGRRPRLQCCCPPSPPLFIGPLGGRQPLGDQISKGGGGQGGGLAPQGKWGAPTLGFPTLGAGGRPMGGAPAH